ncbi:MAG: hypothetical protein MZV64_13080 [Ignavibacteriales bacterium]|nr:hypothetical protein [Ignavibacteriales bacterium]
MTCRKSPQAHARSPPGTTSGRGGRGRSGPTSTPARPAGRELEEFRAALARLRAAAEGEGRPGLERRANGRP